MPGERRLALIFLKQIEDLFVVNLDVRHLNKHRTPCHRDAPVGPTTPKLIELSRRQGRGESPRHPPTMAPTFTSPMKSSSLAWTDLSNPKMDSKASGIIPGCPATPANQSHRGVKRRRASALQHTFHRIRLATSGLAVREDRPVVPIRRKHSQEMWRQGGK